MTLSPIQSRRVAFPALVSLAPSVLATQTSLTGPLVQRGPPIRHTSSNDGRGDCIPPNRSSSSRSELENRVDDDVAQRVRDPRRPQRSGRNPGIGEYDGDHAHDHAQGHGVLFVSHREDDAGAEGAPDDTGSIDLAGEWKWRARRRAIDRAEHQAPIHDLL